MKLHFNATVLLPIILLIISLVCKIGILIPSDSSDLKPDNCLFPKDISNMDVDNSGNVNINYNNLPTNFTSNYHSMSAFQERLIHKN